MRIVPLPSKAKKLLGSFERNEGKVLTLTKGSARNGFNKARKQARLENLRFHDLRHIAISRMWCYGMNVLEISACSGHKAVSYTHLTLPTKA